MSKKRIMIVDDAVMMRLVIQNMLSGDPNLQIVGFAANGKDAHDQLDAFKPDLVLLDIEMPGMDELEFLRHAWLKSDAKVVILSSVTAEDSIKAMQARALGADAVITKPSGAVSHDLEKRRGSELMQTIYKLLGIERGQKQSKLIH